MGGLGVLRVAWVDSVCGFWTGLGVLWCWLWCGWGLCRGSVPTFLRVLGWLGGALVLAWCWLGLCGGNCYHRRCLAACRRRVGGLWLQNPPRGCLEGPASRALSVAVLVVFGLSLCVCRGGAACFCWWLGGNCYHRRCVAACRRRVGGLWLQNPRVVARLRGCVPVWWFGFAVVAGGVVSGGMSLVSLWLGSSLLVAWGELLP